MVNYNNGKIYKIESHLGDKVYIGSTTKELLSQRMTAHRKSFNTWKQGKRDLTTSFLLFDEYGIENCSMVLLELCPCETKDVLHAREAHYIRTVQCVNKMIPQRTQKEYKLDNKEKIKEDSKEYYSKNKEIITEKHKSYYEDNKEHKLEYQRQYKELNKERLHARDNAYYSKNKEEINRKQREKRAAKKLEKQSIQ
jgi:hypothetical protein